MNTQARVNHILGSMQARAPGPLPGAAKPTPRNTSSHGALAMGVTIGILATAAWLLYRMGADDGVRQ